MESMFENCESLISLDLSNFNTQNVTDIRYMFSNCKSLILLNLSNFNTQNVTEMRYIFSNCYSLISLDLSNFNIKNHNNINNDNIFDNCNSLSFKTIKKLNNLEVL